MVNFRYEKNRKAILNISNQLCQIIISSWIQIHNERFQKTDFEQQDTSGYPPLHHAAKNKYLQLFLKMIQMECQYIKACEGTTPSHLAFKTNNYQSFQLFIDNGTDKDANGNKEITPLAFGKLGIKTTLTPIMIVFRIQESNTNKIQMNKQFNFKPELITSRFSEFLDIPRGIIYIIFQYHQFYQQSIMQQETASCTLKCEQHTEQQVVAIHFGEKQLFKCRFICLKCILSLKIKSEHILPIQEFMDDNPLGKVEQFQGEINNIIDWYKAIENSIIELEAAFQNYFKDVRNCMEMHKSQFSSLGMDFNKDIKLEEFKKQFSLINQLDTYQGSQEYIELKETLNEIIGKIETSSNDFIKSNADNYYEFYENHNKKLIQLQGVIDSFRSKINKQLNNYLIEFPELHSKISNGKYMTYELIYQGSKDGLNAEGYWLKCNLQQDLLTIMTSKNGNIFGSFSPCQLNKALGTYVQDITLKSFLFQYNKKEIYPLKTKEYAIYCKAVYGPCYGHGCDVVVDGDFQRGHSNNLSSNYDTSQYIIQDQSTHLFGDKTPQLVECKVYKVRYE